MALQTSGPISLLDIAGEFGGSTPHYISEYYRGGPYVRYTSQTTSIPTSGTIAFSNFYGTSNGFAWFMNSVSNNVNNGVLYNTTYAGGVIYSSGQTPTVRMYPIYSIQSEAGWIAYAGYWYGGITCYAGGRMFGNTYLAFSAFQARGWSAGFLSGGYINWAQISTTSFSYQTTSVYRFTYYPYLSGNMAVNSRRRFYYSYAQALATYIGYST